MVNAIANLLVALVAALHVYFLVLEMFLWTKPLGLKTFRNSPEKAADSAVLAANQGLYNGFLAAGLFWGLVQSTPAFAFQIKMFFLLCVIVAGVYGAATVSRRILFVQAAPAALALVLLWRVKPPPPIRPASSCIAAIVPPHSCQRWRPPKRTRPSTAYGRKRHEERPFSSDRRDGGCDRAVGIDRLRAKEIRYRRDRYRDQDRTDSADLRACVRLCRHRPDPGCLSADDQRPGRHQWPQAQFDPV